MSTAHMDLSSCLRVSLIAAVFGVIGCSAQSSLDASNAQVLDPKIEHEKVMRERWLGKTTLELQQARGKPSIILVLPPKNQTETSAYIYQDNSVSHCIDSFVVQEGSGRIAGFYCR